jgi:ABC-2 type transport system ATP-binding protein
VEALCDRVTIIRAGATVETGTLTQLRHLTRTSITAELAARPDLDQLAGLHGVTIEPGPDQVTELHCEVDAGQLDELLRRLVAAGVRNLVSRPPTLEELFLRHYAAAPAPETASSGAAGPPAVVAEAAVAEAAVAEAAAGGPSAASPGTAGTRP